MQKAPQLSKKWKLDDGATSFKNRPQSALERFTRCGKEGWHFLGENFEQDLKLLDILELPKLQISLNHEVFMLFEFFKLFGRGEFFTIKFWFAALTCNATEQ